MQHYYLTSRPVCMLSPRKANILTSCFGNENDMQQKSLVGIVQLCFIHWNRSATKVLHLIIIFKIYYERPHFEYSFLVFSECKCHFVATILVFIVSGVVCQSSTGLKCPSHIKSWQEMMQVCDLPSLFSLSSTHALLLMQTHTSCCWWWKKHLIVKTQSGFYCEALAKKNAL